MLARLVSFASACLAALVIAGCVATPLPDPPSADPVAMSLSESQPTGLTLTGRDGAIHPGGGRLRVTDTSTADVGGRIEVTVTSGGAFDVTLPGTIADTLYLEQVEPMGGGTFLGAIASAGGTAVMSVPAGPDADADGSPDAIDCASGDPTLGSRECPPGGTPCTTDRDCAAGQTCVAGTCAATGCMTAEVCANGLDDDCNGIVDDGCP